MRLIIWLQYKENQVFEGFSMGFPLTGKDILQRKCPDRLLETSLVFGRGTAKCCDDKKNPHGVCMNQSSWGGRMKVLSFTWAEDRWADGISA